MELDVYRGKSELTDAGLEELSILDSRLME